jgi:hypothetical protein
MTIHGHSLSPDFISKRNLETGLRRVTTGVDALGRSVILGDDIVAGDIRGLLVFGADAPTTAGDGAAPRIEGWWPPPGGVRVAIGTRAPDQPGEGSRRAPGDPWPDIDDVTGFHASNSVDILIMISGRIWLELDDGVEVALGAGDVLVQNGARHRWRNRSDEWPLMACVIFGAHPASDTSRL